jgi:hydroxypyruvate reductase
VSLNDETARLRNAALQIFGEALGSVETGAAMRNAVSLRGSNLQICDSTFDLNNSAHSIYSIAIGKAAWPMACALESILQGRLTGGVLSGPPAPTFRPQVLLHDHLSSAAQSDAEANQWSLPAERWQVFAGGHPLPNQQSLDAAAAAFQLLQRAEAERSLIIFLISGGGSAMLEWPAHESVTLDDLRRANQVLVESGLSINKINAVRRSFSAIKGNKLAGRAPQARQLSLIISDTPEGQEASVASGPTLAPPLDGASPSEIVRRHDLRTRLPDSILQAIDRGAEYRAERQIQQEYYVILHNHKALDAAAEAARQRDFAVEVALDISDQPIESGCEELIARLLRLSKQFAGTGRAVCLISGGEFACPVRGPGRGGRNAETALRLAMHLDRLNIEAGTTRKLRTFVLSAGTDGIDGNSPATGALADHTSISRGSEEGLDAARFLLNSDSFSYFDALGDAIVTGPTGTNVRDIRLLMLGSDRST